MVVAWGGLLVGFGVWLRLGSGYGGLGRELLAFGNGFVVGCWRLVVGWKWLRGVVVGVWCLVVAW